MSHWTGQRVTDMKYVTLNHTNDKISVVALGTDVYGTALETDKAIELLDEYTFLGGNVIDTASVYGGENDNVSEKTIGKWMREKKNRQKLFISTKGAHPKVATMNISRLSKAEIEHDINLSLRNLSTDYIDIYWLHRDDESLCVDEIMDTLAGLVKSGKTRFIGMSNWTHKRIDEANKYAKEHNLSPVISSQIQYSIAKAVVENNDPTLVLMDDAEYEYFKNNDLSVFAYASQAKGFFSKLDNGGLESLSEKAKSRYFCDTNMEIFNRVKTVSKEYGRSVGEVAISALISNTDFQTVPIIGCKNTEQLRESMSGASLVLPQNICNFIMMRDV